MLSLRPRRAVVAPTHIALASRAVPLRIRESPRAKRIAVRIDAAGDAVELVMPPRVSLARGIEFLEERLGWVESRLEHLPPRIEFVNGAVIPVLGVPHRIRHMGARGNGAGAVLCENGQIRVWGAPEHLPRRVRDHLVALARSELAKRARAVAKKIERRVAKISIRDTKSRWGSCATSGNLSFSWRLVLAPEPVLRYVVAHEVAHLAHMNHGVRFWRLVETLAPGSARQRDWLRRNRALLLRYG